MITNNQQLITDDYCKGKFLSLKFYLKVIEHAWRDPLFRAGALHESWGVLRQYLPGRLVTRRSEYVYCSYAGQSGQKDKGRWLPPQSLRFRPSAYALIFDEQNRLLVVRAQAFDTLWNLPGGGANRGETLVEALRREVREETGLEIEVGPLIAAHDLFRIMPTGGAVQSQPHYYLARANGGEFHSQGNGFDSSEVRYLDPATILPDQLHSSEMLFKLIAQARLIGQAMGFF